jgi:hypothetical protein
MSTITIDGILYEEDALSTEAKAQFVSIQACDKNISVLEIALNIAQTARNTYTKKVVFDLGSVRVCAGLCGSVNKGYLHSRLTCTLLTSQEAPI